MYREQYFTLLVLFMIGGVISYAFMAWVPGILFNVAQLSLLPFATRLKD